MLTWLESHGYLPANSGLNQIDYGFEICSTHGAATFAVSQFAHHVLLQVRGLLLGTA